MAKGSSNLITSCTISWQNTGDVVRVVIKVLQTEIQVRFYDGNNLYLTIDILRYVRNSNP